MFGGCFPHEPLPRFVQEAPAQGSVVPNLELRTENGATIRLHEVLDGRPTVLQVGSHSCPVYRYRRWEMRELRERFADRVHFIVLYTREAHPVGSDSPYADGEWDWWGNRLVRARIRDAVDEQERLAAALFSKTRTHSDARFLVDPMDDRGWRTFGSSPSPAFVLDAQGRIVLRQGWVDPKEIAQALERLSNEP